MIISDFLGDRRLTQFSSFDTRTHILKLLGWISSYQLVGSTDWRNRLNILGNVADSVISIQVQFDLGAIVKTNAHYSSGLRLVDHGFTALVRCVDGLGGNRLRNWGSTKTLCFTRKGDIWWWWLFELFLAAILKPNRNLTFEFFLQLFRYIALFNIGHKCFIGFVSIVSEFPVINGEAIRVKCDLNVALFAFLRCTSSFRLSDNAIET